MLLNFVPTPLVVQFPPALLYGESRPPVRRRSAATRAYGPELHHTIP
ncbi:hypothetical protein [Nonomuraea glycinis]